MIPLLRNRYKLELIIITTALFFKSMASQRAKVHGEHRTVDHEFYNLYFSLLNKGKFKGFEKKIFEIWRFRVPSSLY